MKINNLYDTKQMKISAIQINTCTLQMKHFKKQNLHNTNEKLHKSYTIQIKLIQCKLKIMEYK